MHAFPSSDVLPVVVLNSLSCLTLLRKYYTTLRAISQPLHEPGKLRVSEGQRQPEIESHPAVVVPGGQLIQVAGQVQPESQHC